MLDFLIMENKNHQKAEEFAMDESFIRFVVHQTDPDQFWNDFIQQNSHLNHEIEKATQLVLLLSKAKKAEVNADANHELDKLNRQIDSIQSRKNLQLNWFKYAAAVLVFITIGIIIQSDFFRFKTYAAQVQNIQIELNDQSQIDLRKGSTLKVSRFFGHFNRRLSLNGEAYFNVNHNEKHTFEVVTPNGKVRDIGTEFLVNTDSMQTMVMVNKGKVVVITETKQVILTQTMSAKIDANQQIIENPFNINQMGWATGQFNFQQQNLSQILKTLEPFYQVQFELDSKFSDRNLTINVDRLTINEFMQLLTDIIPELHYKQTNKTITIN